MYSSEHFLAKIERNALALDKAPTEIRQQCIDHINWARELSKRLEQLDYQERENAINSIHTVMDEDYLNMGFDMSIDGNEKIMH